MVSPVGKPYHHWLTAHDVRFAALKDVYEKADTLHCDISLGNIILARLKEKTERTGYLIDWELSCKKWGVTPRDHVLTVRLILSSRVEVLIYIQRGLLRLCLSEH